MKYKVKHKAQGWTGILEYPDFVEGHTWSSHGMGFTVRYSLWQDSHDPQGNYVEDPHIDSLGELEFLEKISEDTAHETNP